MNAKKILVRKSLSAKCDFSILDLGHYYSFEATPAIRHEWIVS